MVKLKTAWRAINPAFLLPALFFLVNLIFLTGFPFMHSDEPWLSGLSRHLAVTGDFSATEPFFDLKPRNPHAIRIIFHSIQAVFIKVFGYHWWVMRLISLIFATVGLVYFYKLALVLSKKTGPASLATLLLSVDLQYIYASHLARPEIILCALFILGGYIFLNSLERHSRYHDLLLAGICGVGIGIHPNSFILAVFLIVFYLYVIFITRQLKGIHLIIFTAFTGGFALFFIGLSVLFDPHFLTHYPSYGQTQFQVLIPLRSKWAVFQEFYTNLFICNTGTYYGPDIRLQLILFPIILLLSAMISSSKKTPSPDLAFPMLGILAINFGILLIGRFNPTSAVFQFPFYYLLLIGLLDNLPQPGRRMVSFLLLCAITCVTENNILPFPGFNYSTYLEKIARYVPHNQRALASLNTEYYFDSGKLFDFRNLPYLKQHSLSFTEYISRNQIRYIIYPESIDRFQQQWPCWNFLYGDLAGCYPEMKRFLREECRVVGSFTNGIYGMEIPVYPVQNSWKITIYKVCDPGHF
jgi:hypothetical protein